MALENKLGLTSSAGLAREEERISKKKAWAQIKKDLTAAEKSIREEGMISFSDMRKSLGV